MTHDQLVDLAKAAIEDVGVDESVDEERRLVSLTELRDDINLFLEELSNDA